MLELKNIIKTYITGNFKQNALDGVNLTFSENEFVAILGESGSGKTTLLNIIGGLDRYTLGDLVINGVSTKKFTPSKWDSYRNNSIGFIFQSYNLIPHISIFQNIELSLILSGERKKTRKKKVNQVLKKVGLFDHKNKRPNELSGGEMQRVAIARALVNDPEIILADEPTGALDSKTSVQILDLIKSISKEKLVIMVTHNRRLGEEYASRIIELKDGKIINDSRVKTSEKIKKAISVKKTSMSFFTALKLSFNNIKTKMGRTLLVSLAGSIGILGIALIMSLSNGFDKQIKEFESKTLSNMPIEIKKISFDISDLSHPEEDDLKSFPKTSKIYEKENILESRVIENNITSDYVKYLNNIPKKYLDAYSFDYKINTNILFKSSDDYKFIANEYLMLFPESTDDGLINKTYDVLIGDVYSNAGLILMLDHKNRIEDNLLDALDISDKTSFEDIINKEYKVIFNDELYIQSKNAFSLNTNYKKMYSSGLSIKIQAIIRINENRDDLAQFSQSGIFFNKKLQDLIVSENKNSKIAQFQDSSEVNVFTNTPFTNSPKQIIGDEVLKVTKSDALNNLGKLTTPSEIYLYPKDFESKEKIVDYLEGYKEKIHYIDKASFITTLSSNIMSAITIVLISFSSIALIVSSIMIGIITYISVIERTKEIGILRSLGARKKDITRVFLAEVFIIGLSSGLIGIMSTLLINIPTNKILYELTSLKGVAKLNINHAIILLIVSITLTLIGGFIPSKIAAKKDPVKALRVE